MSNPDGLAIVYGIIEIKTVHCRDSVGRLVVKQICHSRFEFRPIWFMGPKCCCIEFDHHLDSAEVVGYDSITTGRTITAVQYSMSCRFLEGLSIPIWRLRISKGLRRLKPFQYHQTGCIAAVNVFNIDPPGRIVVIITCPQCGPDFTEIISTGHQVDIVELVW